MVPKRISNVYWGVVLVLGGAIFLARNLGLFDFYFSWRRYWPVLLILFGIGWIVKSFAENSKRVDEQK